MNNYQLPNLGYEYSSLEPFIDTKTMEIHHTKHHQAYIDKLNLALEKYPELFEKDIEEILKDINSVPEEIRSAVINHGGGHANHSFFWQILAQNKVMNEKIKSAIEKDFGSIENFKIKFKEFAMARFGSGWTWLVIYNGKLEVISTANQDSPLMQGKKPLLGIDVWEHAYYLKYQNKRADYIDAFWNVINWDKVNEIYELNFN